MKNKKGIIFLILILTTIIIGISQVSAIEIEDTDTSEINTNEIEIEEINDTSPENENNSEHKHTSLTDVIDSEGVIKYASSDYRTRIDLTLSPVSGTEVFKGTSISITAKLYGYYTGGYIKTGKTIKFNVFEDRNNEGYSSFGSFSSSGSVTTSKSGSYSGSTTKTLSIGDITYYYYAHFESDGVARESSDSDVFYYKTYSSWVVDLLGNGATNDITIDPGESVKFTRIIHPIDEASSSASVSLKYTKDDGEEVTSDSISSSSGKTIPLSSYGDYTFYAIYAGDSTHGTNIKSNEIHVHVNGYAPTITLNTLTPENERVVGSSISLKADVTATNSKYAVTGGTITYFVNGVESQTLGLDEIFTYVQDDENYEITAKYNGNNYYYPVDISETINAVAAGKLRTSVVTDLTKTTFYTDDTINFNIIIKDENEDNVNGKVNILINNTLYENVNIGFFNFPNHDEGTYNITINYEGDDNYIKSSTSFIINLIKHTPIFTSSLSNNEIMFDETTIFNFNLESAATGTIEFYIDNIKKDEFSGNSYTYTPENKGTFTLKAKYLGNENYYSCEAEYTLTVNKYLLDLNIGITNEELFVGKTYTISPNLNVTDATGTITVNIDGEEKQTINTNEVYSFTPSSNKQYLINLKYNGEDKYDNVDCNLNVKVKATPNTFYLSYLEDYGLKNSQISISKTLTNGVTGNIVYYVDGEKISNLSTSQTFTYTPTSRGLKKITAVYEGNDYWTNATASINVRIKETPEFTFITPNYAVVNVPCTVSLVLPDDATGTIDYYRAAKLQKTTDVSESYSYTFTSSNTYARFSAIYGGDENYTSIETDTIYIYSLIPHTVTISSVFTNATLVGDTYYIPVSSNIRLGAGTMYDTTGSSSKNFTPSWNCIEVYYDGDYLISANTGKVLLLNGTNRLIYPVGDYEGEHEVYLKFLENYTNKDVYFEAISPTIKVITYMPGKVHLSVGNKTDISINHGEKLSFDNWIMPIAAQGGTGEFRINGTSKGTFTIGNSYEYTFNTPGDYNITVYYQGKGSYGKNLSNSVIVHVLGEIPEIDFLSSENNKFSKPITISPSLPSDAKGTVTYFINGIKNQTLNYDENFIYTPYSEDDLIITMQYDGDIKYCPVNCTKTLTATYGEPTITKITLSANEIKLGESISITVEVFNNEELLNGKVNISIDGDIVEFTIGETKNINFNKFGEKNIQGIYLGDDTYAPSSSEFKILKVIGEKPSIRVSLDKTEISTNQMLIITPVIDRTDADGKFDILIDGEVVGTVFVGESFNYIPREAKTYTFSAVYKGDDKYEEVNSETISLNVNTGSSISLTFAGTTEITRTWSYSQEYSKYYLFKATFSNGYTSGEEVTFYIDGVNISDTKVQYLDSGMHISPLYVGDLHYMVSYNGVFSNEVIYHVTGGSDTETTLSINLDTVNLGESISITPSVSSNSESLSSGTVSYYLASGMKIGEVSVSESFIYIPSKVGNFEVYGVYNAYKNYYSSTSNLVSFKVEDNTEITSLDLILSTNSVTVDGQVVIKINLKDSEGNLVNGKDIKLYINDSEKNLVSGEDFTFTPVSVGEYLINAIFDGDNAYAGSESTTYTIDSQFIVPTLSFSLIPSTVNLGESITISPSLSSGTGDISIFIDDVELKKIGVSESYTYTTTKAGDLKVKLVYNGDSKHKSVSETKDLIVTKISTLSLSSDTLTSVYGDTVHFTTSLSPSSATGTVKLYLDDVEIGTFNGDGVLDYTLTSSGTLEFIAKYSNGNYDDSESNKLSISIDEASTTTTISLSKTSFEANEEIIVSSIVKSGDTTLNSGTVKYYNKDNTLIGEEEVNKEFKFSKSSSGDYEIYGVYQGISNYKSSTSTSVSYSIGKLDTVTTISLNNNPVDVNTPVTIKVEVKNANTLLTGIVSLKITGEDDQSIDIGDEISFTPTKGGQYTISAVFTGTETYATSNNELTLTVNKLTPSISWNMDKETVKLGDSIIVSSDFNEELEVLVNGESVGKLNNGELTYTTVKAGNNSMPSS